MMRLSMGYPVPEAEKQLYFHGDRRKLLHKLQAVGSPETLSQWQEQVQAITLSEAVADYIFRLVAATRRAGCLRWG